MQNETLHTFKFLMENRKYIELRAEGYSMYPHIRPGDICRFSPVQHPLKKGQVGLVVSPRGVLFSHRLISQRISDGERIYSFRGDMNPYPDEPSAAHQVVGVLTSLTRNGKKVEESLRSRRFWSWVMVKFQYFFRMIGCLMLMADTDRETMAMHRRRTYGFRNPKGS